MPAATTAQPGLQLLRGLLLAGVICVAVYGFTLMGLVESHAAFACYPLLVAALSGPILGERVGWRRWSAIGSGGLTGEHHHLCVHRDNGAITQIKEQTIHLSLTAASLGSVGGFVERLTGPAGLVVSYLFSGLFGALARTYRRVYRVAGCGSVAVVMRRPVYDGASLSYNANPEVRRVDKLRDEGLPERPGFDSRGHAVALG